MKRKKLLIAVILFATVLLAVELPVLFPAFQKLAGPTPKASTADYGGYYVSTLSAYRSAYSYRPSPISKAIAAGIVALFVGGIKMIVSAFKEPSVKSQPMSDMKENTETPADSRTTLKPGTIVADRYMIESELGFGEYGKTYSAQDRATGSRVAFIEYFPVNAAKREPGGVSVYPLSSAKQDEYENGRAEFISDANSLTHLGEYGYNAQILDRFERNGTAYCVSEYLENVPLEMYIPNAFYDSEWMKR